MAIFGKKSKETALSVMETREIATPVDREKIVKWLDLFGKTKGLEESEKEAFIEMATLHNLNPFNREIHVSAYGKGEYRTLAIVTGYEVYIKKAEESGKLEYWDVIEAEPGTPIEEYWATLVVKRRDRNREQKWTAYYSEAVQTKYSNGTHAPNAIWHKQPRQMTRKVAMGQGFRLFFEDVLHGIPYTEDEVGSAESQVEARNVTPAMPKEVEEKIERTVARTEAKIETVFEGEVVEEQPKGDSWFKLIMTIINNPAVPGMDKPILMNRARPFMSDPWGSGAEDLYKELKEKYNV